MNTGQQQPSHPARRIRTLTQLDAMGLREEWLGQAMRVAYESAATCTENDPVGLSGTLKWAKGTRSLRELLLPQGWFREDRENLPTVVHPKRAFAIAVARGNSYTGREDTPPPTTFTPKGPATERAVRRNQVGFTAQDDPAFGLPNDDDGLDTWLLLHYFDPEREEIRLELSLPAEISAGYVKAWHQRLTLSPVSFSTDVDLSEEDEATDEIDISISRR